MKINLTEYKNKTTLDTDINIKEFNETYITSVIKHYDSIEGTIEINPINGAIYELNFAIKTKLEVISSLTLKPFKKTLKIEDQYYFTTDPNFDSNDVLYTGENVDLDEIIFSLIVSSLPINLHAPNEGKIEGDGYRVITEEELEKEEKSSPFDILKDIDLDE